MLRERSARVWLLNLASVIVLGAAACGNPGSPTSPPPVAAAPTPAPSPRAVVISVDGLRADALAKTDLPNLRGLVNRGAYSYAARTVIPSETLPGHASMLTGTEPWVHQITRDWDDFKPEKGFVAVPTVFSVAKAAGLRTVMVVGKKKLQHLAPPGTVDTFVLTERGDADVANEAVVQAGTGFDLLFVHFPDVDLAGHAEGWMSAGYLAALARLDAALGRLIVALPPEATVILTADHGGKDHSHGRDIPEDMTVPWVVAGPKVVRRGELTSPIKETDTAATVLWTLGLRLPSGCAGAVVQGPFAAP
jgi:predicted AlkP superfamily pyrophosphatase or phosphodiesterase